MRSPHKLGEKLSFTFFDGGDDVVDDLLDGFNSVIVGRNDIVDISRINVGIGDSKDGDAEGISFFNSILILDGIGDEDSGGLFHHFLDAAVAFVEKIDFLLETLDFEL